nr:unnamed protein product [Callosobruchus chinensis]
MEKKDNPPHCKYFVLRKKRYCKMTVKPGEEYCGEHQKVDTSKICGTPENNIRIVCPLDKKHTCYAHKLKKHLKICNARPKATQPYISKGINSGMDMDNADEFIDSYKLLSSFPVTDIRNTILKVNKIYETIVSKVLSHKISSNNIVEQMIIKPEHGDKAKKHLIQNSSILGLLQEYNLIQPSTCYIEFGAGRGQLSFWLAHAVNVQESSSILLIEKASPKHKKDNKLARNSDSIKRIRADISDVVLDKLDNVEKSKNIVGVTKHLCGVATDLALRCLSNATQNKVAGGVFTFCCHHRCCWTPYTGKQFFQENNLTMQDFYIMCGMASWATCGSGLSRERRKVENMEHLKQSDRDVEIGLTRDEKAEVGRRSKNVINYGRLFYLSQLGLKCHLHYYVDTQVTLENVCIVAYR